MVLSQATLAHPLAAGDAEVGVGFPVVCVAIAYPRVIWRETTEEVVVAAALCERESGVQFRKVVHGVEVEALLTEKRGAARAAGNGWGQLLVTVASTVATRNDRDRLGAAVVFHEVHDMLDGKVVGQLGDVAIWNLCRDATLWAADAPTLLAQLGFLDGFLQTVLTVGVRAGQDTRLFKVGPAPWALQL